MTNVTSKLHPQKYESNQNSTGLKMGQTNVLMLGPSLEQKGGMATVQKLILEFRNQDINIKHICTHEEGTISHRIIIFIKALSNFIRQLWFYEFDLVHIHLSEKGSVFRKSIFTLITFIFDKPIVLHAHGAEFETFFIELPGILKKIFGFIFRRCNALIVLSKTQEKFYIKHLCLDQKRVFVLPNAVSIPQKTPIVTQNRGTLTLISIGRVGHRKGTFDLIKAFARLPNDLRSKVQLCIAGDGEIEAGERLTGELGLAHQVEFLGWITSERRNKILAAADVFILPSYYEAFPMSILEAMAWGLAIITTPVGGIPDLITSNENGVLVKPGNIEELTTVISVLIQEKQMRLSLGKSAKYTVKSFDINLYSKNLADLYKLVSYQK
jgi:glycosyltransferase involved in cell wall biosynthesis